MDVGFIMAQRGLLCPKVLGWDRSDRGLLDGKSRNLPTTRAFISQTAQSVWKMHQVDTNRLRLAVCVQLGNTSPIDQHSAQ